MTNKKIKPNEDVLSKFRERVRALRIEKGWTMVQFAEILGISPATVNDFEKTSSPKLSLAVEIAKTFGVSLDWLVGLTDNREGSDAEIGERIGLSIEAITNLRKTSQHLAGRESNEGGDALVSFNPEYRVWSETKLVMEEINALTNHPATGSHNLNLTVPGQELRRTLNGQDDVEEWVSRCQSAEYRDDCEMFVANDLLSNWDLIAALARYCRSLDPSYMMMVRANEIYDVAKNEVLGSMERLRYRFDTGFEKPVKKFSDEDKAKVDLRFRELDLGEIDIPTGRIIWRWTQTGSKDDSRYNPRGD